MKIVLKGQDGSKAIRLPNFLLMTPVGKNWLKKEFGIRLDRSQLKQVFKALNRFKKQVGLPLVKVISEDSEVTVLW